MSPPLDVSAREGRRRRHRLVALVGGLMVVLLGGVVGLVGWGAEPRPAPADPRSTAVPSPPAPPPAPDGRNDGRIARSAVWYGAGSLHLAGVLVAVDGVTSMVPVRGGTVVADGEGRLLLLTDEGARTAVTRTVSGGYRMQGRGGAPARRLEPLRLGVDAPYVLGRGRGQDAGELRLTDLETGGPVVLPVPVASARDAAFGSVDSLTMVVERRQTYPGLVAPGGTNLPRPSYTSAYEVVTCGLTDRRCRLDGRLSGTSEAPRLAR